MALQTWAYVAEIIGVVAVVVTLIFLTVQLRQNTLALRSSATNEVHEQLARIYFDASHDAELSSIFVRGSDDPSSLDPVEMARYFALLQGVMFVLQNVYLQTEANLLERETLLSWSRVVGALTTTKGFQAFWEQRKYILNPGLRRYVEEELTQTHTGREYPLGAAVMRQ